MKKDRELIYRINYRKFESFIPWIFEILVQASKFDNCFYILIFAITVKLIKTRKILILDE